MTEYTDSAKDFILQCLIWYIGILESRNNDNDALNDNQLKDVIVLPDIGKEIQLRWNEIEHQSKVLRYEFLEKDLGIIGDDSGKEQALFDEWNAKNKQLIKESIGEMKKVLQFWMDIHVRGWITPVYEIVKERRDLNNRLS